MLLPRIIPIAGPMLCLFSGLIPLARAQFVQQGSRLVNAGGPVALSADGNTLVAGSGAGVAVFTRASGSWSQQGATLAGTGATGSLPLQGSAVAISGDGNTLIEAALSDAGVAAKRHGTRAEAFILEVELDHTCLSPAQGLPSVRASDRRGSRGKPACP